jgi:dihydroneopterin aldolase
VRLKLTGDLVGAVGCRYSEAPGAREMDIIFLEDLRIETVIGIFDWERRIKQTVAIDLEMATDIRPAAASDSIEDTLNYKAVAKRLIQFVGDSEFFLIETLAERVAQVLIEEFGLPWVRVRLSKPGAVRGSRNVGVLIERGQRT